jgi:hypothetical protein
LLVFCKLFRRNKFLHGQVFFTGCKYWPIVTISTLASRKSHGLVGRFSSSSPSPSMIPDFVLLIPFLSSNATLLSFDRILLEFVLHALIDEPSPYYAKLLGLASTMRSIFLSMPWKSPINVSVVVHSYEWLSRFLSIIDPPSNHLCQRLLLLHV